MDQDRHQVMRTYHGGTIAQSVSLEVESTRLVLCVFEIEW